MASMRLTALRDGVADQAHAAEFAGDEDAGHVGLEVGLHHGNIDAAFFLPNTSVMASTGQAMRQAPWPMQWLGLSSVALPSMSPRTFCSGQALAQEPQPMQRRNRSWDAARRVR